MLRNFPFVGDFPVALHFGERPDLFGKVSHSGVPLRGHPGIDFALPEGTPVVAVQHGVVLAVEENPAGYGTSVMLGHRWGQTFYGHLSETRVQSGQQVGASQIIGLSGRGGLQDAPHLHFGLRLIPYSTADGWAGFSDPEPYLARLTEPKGAIIGPHIIGAIHPHLELLARWQPRLITVLDPNPDEMVALREACPQSVIVGRLFVPNDELADRIRRDPAAAANWAHELVRGRATPAVHYWQFANEVLQEIDSLAALNRFELARMRLAERSGYRCALFGFSVGNPDLPEADPLAAWRKLFPSLERAEKKGHVVALHQYGMPDLWGPNNAFDWYILRLEHQVLRYLPFRRLKFAVTEFGIDGLIRGDQPAGWQTFTTPEGYVEQLLKCGRYLERFSGRVLGYSVFTLGHNAPWSTYDIAGKAATYLADLSEKGTWLEVDTQVFDITARESDTDPDPGPELLELAQAPSPAPPAAAQAEPEASAPVSEAGPAPIDTAAAPQEEPQPLAEPAEPAPPAPVEEPPVAAAAEPPPTEPLQTIPEPEAAVVPSTPEEPAQAPPPTPGEPVPLSEPPAEEPLPPMPAAQPEETVTPAAEAQAEPGPAEPGSGPLGEPPSEPLVVQRMAPTFAKFNMTVKSITSRPDHPTGDVVYLVKDVFMTFYGSWEVTGGDDSVADWARADYLRPEFMEAGADHHLFAAVIGLDGQFVKNHEVLFWSDGFERLGDPGYTAYSRERTKDSSGWANIFMAGGSSFVPESGESGPWCWAPAGAAEVVCGGGLPLNHPVSTFVVWQAVPRSLWESTVGEQPTEQPVEPTPPTGKPGPLPSVETRISEWIPLYNVTIKPLSARPDKATGDVIYLVRDIFTTRNGSWEPLALPGSVPSWARDDYLKPPNAPDYFDDAGGDHHLFAAVIGLDGKLVRQQEVIFWSDGFEMLSDPDYDGYVHRFTKERSGWTNIITGPGSSYVPERGESGPWCWAPLGAAEVVCGGGLPANHHISFFVVWQAVANPGGTEPTTGTQDGDIFLPVVPRAGASGARAVLPPVPELNAVAAQVLRQAVWSRLGLEFNADSTIAAYARRANLGMPVTQEFEVSGLRVQGYHGGIVVMRAGDSTRVGHIAW